ncbi:hypothetical protein NPIL_525481 [Nephila pilipes]|uniref:Uncharacterized protein n=1 Tax=Nephila pilipes TaxID=299642 RepID=A0A8X6MGA3_NEPPI|nr:hypothetical protein NPIL_525481 [Nephila pilipes]
MRLTRFTAGSRARKGPGSSIRVAWGSQTKRAQQPIQAAYATALGLVGLAGNNMGVAGKWGESGVYLVRRE